MSLESRIQRMHPNARRRTLIILAIIGGIGAFILWGATLQQHVAQRTQEAELNRLQGKTEDEQASLWGQVKKLFNSPSTGSSVQDSLNKAAEEYKKNNK